MSHASLYMNKIRIEWMYQPHLYVFIGLHVSRISYSTSCTVRSFEQRHDIYYGACFLLELSRSESDNFTRSFFISFIFVYLNSSNISISVEAICQIESNSEHMVVLILSNRRTLRADDMLHCLFRRF